MVKNSYQKLSLPAASGKMVLRYGMTNHLKERLFVPKMWWMHTVNSPQHLWLLHLVFHVTAWDLLARSRGLSLPSLHIPAEPSAWERAGSTRTHTGLLMTTDSPLERAGNFWTKKKQRHLSLSQKKHEIVLNLHSPSSRTFYGLNQFQLQKLYSVYVTKHFFLDNVYKWVPLEVKEPITALVEAYQCTA